MIVALSTIFIGIKSYRDKESAGFISFGKAFKVGLFITLIASAFYVAAWMLYLNTSDTNFMDTYYQQNIEKIKTSSGSEAEVQAKIADIKKSQELYKNNPLIQIGFTFLEIFPVGLLITIICAAILKRNKKKPHNHEVTRSTMGTTLGFFTILSIGIYCAFVFTKSSY